MVFLWQKKVKYFLATLLVFLYCHFFINPDLVIYFVKRIIVNCFDSYNIQYPIWGKRDSRFWQEYSEFLYIRRMANTVLREKIMSFLQINLNQMQNALFCISHAHCFRLALIILPQSTLMRRGEYNIIALFLQLEWVMWQLLTFLRQ